MSNLFSEKTDEEQPLCCPFCGCMPDEGPYNGAYTIYCPNSDCGVQPEIVRKIRSRCIKNWNKRYSTPWTMN